MAGSIHADPGVQAAKQRIETARQQLAHAREEQAAAIDALEAQSRALRQCSRRVAAAFSELLSAEEAHRGALDRWHSAQLQQTSAALIARAAAAPAHGPIAPWDRRAEVGEHRVGAP